MVHSTKNVLKQFIKINIIYVYYISLGNELVYQESVSMYSCSLLYFFWPPGKIVNGSTSYNLSAMYFFKSETLAIYFDKIFSLYTVF